MNLFLDTYVQYEEHLVMKDITESSFELTENDYVMEGFGDTLSKIKETLVKWLGWLKDKIVAIFSKIKEFVGKICDFFLKAIKTMRKKAKEWYANMTSKKPSTESFDIATEATSLEELSRESVPSKVVNGFEHANFKGGLFEYIDPIVNDLYKAALNNDENLFTNAQRSVDKFKDISYYRNEVLGTNQMEDTLKYTEEYSEKMVSNAKRFSESMSNMYQGKFNNYITQLTNKIKTDPNVDKQRASFIQKAIGKLSTLCTFFKDGMASILRRYCYIVMQCCRKCERYRLMKNGMAAGDKIFS